MNPWRLIRSTDRKEISDIVFRRYALVFVTVRVKTFRNFRQATSTFYLCKFITALKKHKLRSNDTRTTKIGGVKAFSKKILERTNDNKTKKKGVLF